jgi:peptidoglycan/LPS O-acetylase OafA/YrhL
MIKKYKFEFLLGVGLLFVMIGWQIGWIIYQVNDEFLNYLYKTHNSFVLIGALIGVFLTLVGIRNKNKFAYLGLVFLGLLCTLSCLYSFSSWIPDSTERQILNILLSNGYWFTLIGINTLIFSQFYILFRKLLKKNLKTGYLP